MDAALVLLLAFGLDLLLADPPDWPHPVVAIGKVITTLERLLRALLPATPRWEVLAGGALALAVSLATAAVGYALLFFAGLISPALAFAGECFLLYQCLAARGLADAANAVRRELELGNLPAAREALSRIVGRDAAGLDGPAVARAAVETVSENASDGVVAPMFYYAVGGLPLALLYKAVNTMDSMIAYKNAKYLHFGRTAARLDDAANFIPARLTGLLMIPAAFVCRLDWQSALTVLRRDRHHHASPNAGHPEAACAGALGIWLGGDSDYGGVTVSKPILGGGGREAVPEDIRRAVGLMYAAAVLCLFFCCGIELGARAWN